MRVYTPEKNVSILEEVLKELYLLKQAIDHQSTNVDSQLKMVSSVREKIQKVISLEEEKTNE
tara:strand:+ start:1721 stop:1906 length:186 start_codon:yes stop_codon:yes gene_type:complete